MVPVCFGEDVPLQSLFTAQAISLQVLCCFELRWIPFISGLRSRNGFLEIMLWLTLPRLLSVTCFPVVSFGVGETQLRNVMNKGKVAVVTSFLKYASVLS